MGLLACLGLACLGLASCSSGSGSGSGGGGGGTTTDPYANITGNWQFNATPTTGPAPFTVLSGNIDEIPADAYAHSATAALLAQSTGCFANAGVVPLKGQVEQPTVKLLSFEVLGQYLTLTGTKDETGATMTGTYSVQGGCADGDAGTFTAAFYKALTGTYEGPLTAAATKQVQLSLTQSTLGTSGGTFLLGGSAALSGFSCFSKGTVLGSGASFVTGSTAMILVQTNETGSSQMLLSGNLDPAASTLTLSSIEVTGGSCAGSYGGATLAQS